MNNENSIESTDLCKIYRLGTIGMSSLREDISRWWNKGKKQNDTEAHTRITNTNKTQLINGSEFWALRNLDFSIRKGEVVGIIGANGSGKSTLLKIISRITEPTKGTVKVRGKVASLLEVGTGFHPELTGRENIYINGAILGMTRREVEERFDLIVDFAGVIDFIDTPIKRYSSGMTVRLGFAVAAHLDPDILIVDEVLAVGDASFQRKCINKMKDISSRGKTILFVSHQLPMIEKLCSSAMLLEDGMIKEKGEPVKLINNYIKETLVKPERLDLVRCENRKGTGEIKIERIKIVSPSLGESNTIKIGESASFFFYFNLIKKTKKETSFRFAITNNQGKRITTIDSRSVNLDIEPESSFCIKTKFNKISFAEGSYTITTFIGYNEDAYDWVINAYVFDVISGDFYGTGRIQKLNDGEVHSEFIMNTDMTLDDL